MKSTRPFRVRRLIRSSKRRGAAAVEFAVVAPVLVAVVLGAMEVSKLLEFKHTTITAVREGARIAGIDRSETPWVGESTNDKIEQDVTNFLRAAGVNVSDLVVSIVSPDDHTTPMNLDDPSTELDLFELRVELPSSASASLLLPKDVAMETSLVFRNAPSTLVQ